MQRSGSLLALCLAALALLVALADRLPSSIAHAAVEGDETASPRIAVVASIRLMNDLMDSERFKPARDETEKALQAEFTPIVDQGRAMEEQLRGLDQDTDQARALKQQLMNLQGALARKQQEVGVRFEQFIAGQSREAYKLVRDSAVAMAQNRGFTYVIASQSADDDLTEGPVAGLLNDLLGRPVLHAPETADITDDVRADLKLD
jgi:Skp family chaperone for outer membrane proteins